MVRAAIVGDKTSSRATTAVMPVVLSGVSRARRCLCPQLRPIQHAYHLGYSNDLCARIDPHAVGQRGADGANHRNKREVVNRQAPVC
jgi:hypothetical protein